MTPVSFQYNGEKFNIQIYSGEGEHKGWLIKQCLSDDEQKDFFQYTIELSNGSAEQKEILDAKPERAFPISYYNLVYTGKSNCQKPKRWLNFASYIWHMLLENNELLDFPTNTGIGDFDSVYCQLFGNNSSMALHKDQHVNWGVSISFGSSCVFTFGEDKVILESGDVFVADFSKVDHAVDKVFDVTAPTWWNSNEFKDLTFNRVRCSVQIRDLTHTQEHDLISMEEFKELVQNY